MLVLAWSLIAANIFMLGMHVGRWIGRREMRRHLEALGSECPNCRHYGTFCDVCESEKEGTER